MDLQFDVVNGCFEVTSHACDSNGYPVMTLEGKQDRIYRHIYRMEIGPILPGEVIRHICDNRKCINPNHLVKGTHADNVADRVERKRSAFGERNGRAKLCNRDVVEIFNDKKTPKMHLAKKYNVSPKTIRNIQQGKKWKNANMLTHNTIINKATNKN